MRSPRGPEDTREPWSHVGPLRMEFLATDDLMPKFDLLFAVLPQGKELVVEAQFDLALFAPASVEVMIELFRICLSVAADAPETTVGDIVSRLALASKSLGLTANERIK